MPRPYQSGPYCNPHCNCRLGSRPVAHGSVPPAFVHAHPREPLRSFSQPALVRLRDPTVDENAPLSGGGRSLHGSLGIFPAAKHVCCALRTDLPSYHARMVQRSSSGVADKLLAHRDVFKAFIASRVGSDADAEDLLQNGLVKALKGAGEVREDEKTVAWFYRVLRNTIVDHVRSRLAAAKREEAWALETLELREDLAAERQICACFEKMLPELKPLHAELLRRVELQNESVAQAAAALGITPNNASVTLHRARAALRTKLMDFCGDCRCLDNCECD